VEGLIFANPDEGIGEFQVGKEGKRKRGSDDSPGTQQKKADSIQLGCCLEERLGEESLQRGTRSINN